MSQVIIAILEKIAETDAETLTTSIVSIFSVMERNNQVPVKKTQFIMAIHSNLLYLITVKMLKRFIQ